MLKHLVFLSFENAEAADRSRELKAMLDALPGAIADIKEWETGINLVSGDHAAHLSIISGFEDEAAMERYRVHPEHQRVVAYIKQHCRERRVVDYHN